MNGTVRPTVIGFSDRVDVMSLGPAVLGLTSPIPFQLRPAFSDAESSVELAWNGPGTPRRETIATGYGSMRFRYQARGAPPDKWQSVWDRPAVELALIEVAFVATATHRTWSKTIQVEAVLPAACAADPLRSGCPIW
jgi:hypothetical protein